MVKNYGKWFPTVKCTDEAECRIICFPYAGAGATVFMEWFRLLPDNVECFPVAYPHREKRSKEDMPSSIRELAHLIASENELAFSETPCIIYGHCEGGAIAYETAIAIKELYGITPELYVASGVNPPCVPMSISIDENMDLEEAAHTFVNLKFIPEQFATNATFLKCFVPVLFADFVLFQKYCDTEYKMLDCPIMEVHGADDLMIEKDRTVEWEKYTTSNVTYSTYPGEHFYAIGDVLKDLISEILQKRGGIE